MKFYLCIGMFLSLLFLSCWKTDNDDLNNRIYHPPFEIKAKDNDKRTIFLHTTVGMPFEGSIAHVVNAICTLTIQAFLNDTIMASTFIENIKNTYRKENGFYKHFEGSWYIPDSLTNYRKLRLYGRITDILEYSVPDTLIVSF